MRAKMGRREALGILGSAAAAGWLGHEASAACCYFAAKDKDISQPAQKAFIDWRPTERVEAFTVQPKFEGNALDFGMVIPTPSQPKLDEMPRDFFKLLAVFTILEPMPLEKYKRFPRLAANKSGASAVFDDSATLRVQVLEEGVVGSLDYKIVKADDARDLYAWLDDHKYHYAGDEQTLDFYVAKKWFFTVMKIDPKQMKPRADGSFEGLVSPTRFTFTSERLVYPLRITKLSVKEFTEALFYVQAPEKMDLTDSLSYACTWQPMWAQAMDWCVSRTAAEEAWLAHVQPHLAKLNELAARLRADRLEPTALEWCQVIGDKQLGVLEGTVPYNRDAPADDVRALKQLSGHVKRGQVITKFRKKFHVREMEHDLEFARAAVADKPDSTAYYEILPTSPP